MGGGFAFEREPGSVGGGFAKYLINKLGSVLNGFISLEMECAYKLVVVTSIFVGFFCY